MSDAPRSENVDPVESKDPKVEASAYLRRAPKLGVIVGTGIAVGAVFGASLGFALPNETGTGRVLVALVIALGFALAGGLVSGGIAVQLDRASVRRTTEVELQTNNPEDGNAAR